MPTGETVMLLANFVTGLASLSDLEQFVDNRLFELRQSPIMTEDEKFLSSLELMLHELKEGHGTELDIYATVQAFLDTLIQVRVHQADKPAVHITVGKEKMNSLSKHLSSPNSQTRYEDLPLIPVG